MAKKPVGLRNWPDERMSRLRDRLDDPSLSSLCRLADCKGRLFCYLSVWTILWPKSVPNSNEKNHRPLSSQNRDVASSLAYTNLSGTISPHFNESVPLKVIVHGFGSSCHRVWPREMRLSFLAVVSVSFNHCPRLFSRHSSVKQNEWIYRHLSIFRISWVFHKTAWVFPIFFLSF